jgi:hypothetical protein
MVSGLKSPRRRPLGAFAFASAIVAAALGSTAPARADSMDPAIERLVLQPNFKKLGANFNGTCQQIAANPAILNNKKLFPTKINAPANAAAYACQPDNVSFDNLVSEYAFAIAPNAFHPARTTGFGGFALTVEANYTKINSNATDSSNVQYWHEGTQGPTDPTTNKFSIKNVTPDSLLQVYSLKARKGFPFGFEITGDVGFIPNTLLWVAGADVRWALLEGFRTGFLGYIPDVSVGGGVRTMTGTSEFDLTTVGLDAQVSKGIPLADSAVLTPYVGYQHLWVFGDSQSVSFTPNTNPLTQCGFNGDLPNGQPRCRNTAANSNFAFNEDSVFANVRNHRDRGIIGLNYRYEVLYLAGQFLIDLIDPSSEDPMLAGGRQWTLSFEGGVYF